MAGNQSHGYDGHHAINDPWPFTASEQHQNPDTVDPYRLELSDRATMASPSASGTSFYESSPWSLASPTVSPYNQNLERQLYL